MADNQAKPTSTLSVEESRRTISKAGAAIRVTTIKLNASQAARLTIRRSSK